MEEFNLHLTGDIHAITAANNLVSVLYNLFSLLLMMRPNKLECLCLANTFQSSLTFAGAVFLVVCYPSVNKL
jgi:hypothetical protein